MAYKWLLIAREVFSCGDPQLPLKSQICVNSYSLSRLPPPPRLEGVLAVNDILTKAEYILKDEILGPESIIVDGGN